MNRSWGLAQDRGRRRQDNAASLRQNAPRDLPDAELHLLHGGHWALETNLDEIVALARELPPTGVIRPPAKLASGETQP